jgi:hypothetical protein
MQCFLRQLSNRVTRERGHILNFVMGRDVFRISAHPRKEVLVETQVSESNALHPRLQHTSPLLLAPLAALHATDSLDHGRDELSCCCKLGRLRWAYLEPLLIVRPSH